MVRTFTGESIAGVLDQVRQAFGPNAVILDTQSENLSAEPLMGTVSRVTIRAADGAVSSSPAVSAAPPSEGSKSLHILDLSESTDSEQNQSDQPTEPDSWADAFQRLRGEVLSRRMGGGDSDIRNLVFEWLSSQPELFSGVIDAYAASACDTVPEPSHFLSHRQNGQTVLFVGSRGSGKSTALFKCCAARWQETNRKPRLLILAEDEEHGHQRLLDWGRSGAIACDAYAIAQAPRLRTLARNGDDDLFLEYVPRTQNACSVKSTRAILKSLKPDVVALVINGTAAPSVWSEHVDRFAAFGAQHLIVTHWDERTPWWDLAALARATGLRLSYRTAGCEPFAELEAFTAAEIRNSITDCATRAFGSEETNDSNTSSGA